MCKGRLCTLYAQCTCIYALMLIKLLKYYEVCLSLKCVTNVTYNYKYIINMYYIK